MGIPGALDTLILAMIEKTYTEGGVWTRHPRAPPRPFLYIHGHFLLFNPRSKGFDNISNESGVTVTSIMLHRSLVQQGGLFSFNMAAWRTVDPIDAGVACIIGSGPLSAMQSAER